MAFIIVKLDCPHVMVLWSGHFFWKENARSSRGWKEVGFLV